MLLFVSRTDPELARHLREGCVGVLRTDTIYGLVARAENEQAVAHLYEIKHREGKPGTLIAASVSQLRLLGLDDEHLRKVVHLWPNPVSVVLPASESLAYLHQGKASLAVRIPKDEELRALLEQTGPLLTSSANWPGEDPAHTIEEAQDYFGDEADFYVDSGDTRDAQASTVCQLKDDGTLEVLRQGSISIEQKETA